MKRLIALALLLLLVFPSVVFADFADNSSDATYGFGAGTLSNTQWNSGSSWQELNSTGKTAGTGTYTSRIIDALTSTSWSTFGWTPSQPYLKELPNSAVSETAYSTGNANMTNNVLLMHMNESSGSLDDTSGSSISGTVSGNPTYSSTGEFNSSLLFDGTGDYVTLTNSANLQLTSTPTISAWVKITGGNGTSRGIFSKFTLIGGNYKGYAITLRSDNKFQVIAGNNSALNTVSKSNSAYTDSNWHHIAAVKTGGKFLLYIDGVVQTEQATSPITDTGAAAVIGRDYSNLNSGYFVGNIDEVSVYSRSLGASEILNLYKRGTERVRFQVRSCGSSCTSESYVGPDGTSGSYFEEQDSNTTALPSFSLSGVVSAGRYFQYQATLETSNTSYSPDIKSVSIGTPSIGVLSSNFSAPYGTTDLSVESNLAAVSGLRLGNQYGNLTWTNDLDVRQQDFNSNVSVGSDYVSVNASGLLGAFDSEATVSMNVNDCTSYTIYYDSTFRTNASDIIANGQVCDANSTPACTADYCSGNVLTFTVPHFDSYGVIEGSSPPPGGGGDPPTAPPDPPAPVPEYSTLIFALILGGLGWFIGRKAMPQLR